MNLYKIYLVMKDTKIYSNDPSGKIQVNILGKDFEEAFKKLVEMMLKEPEEYRNLKIYSIRESITDIK